ncbi:hypothetical protein BDZ89DRAFT_1040796 [Hymenopellis radicata]|nr:hypothetical protein BDZ89DRAFT_1040796 [Hymenopellis radicata]
MTTYYSDELKELDRCLKALPKSIPVNNAYSFANYEPDPTEIEDYGSVQSVVNKHLEPEFGRGPALEAVVPILRASITGRFGENLLLIKWVDDLTAAAKIAIEADGGIVPREVQTTAAKRLLEDESSQRVQNKKHKATKAHQDEQRREAQKLTEQGDVGVPLEKLVDIVIALSGTGGKRAGKPANALLDQCTIRCTLSSDPNVVRWRCSGLGCRTNWAHPRQSARVLSHATNCSFHAPEVREAALQASSGKALSVQVAADEATPPSTSKPDMFSAFKRQGAIKDRTDLAKFQTKSNLYTLELICDACLPVAVVDNPKFRQLVNHLQHQNGIFVGSTFSTNYIPFEAARVTVRVYEYLKTQYFLSITFDGSSLRRPQSVYTVHITVTTLYGRESYFVHGDEAFGVSHAGEHLANVLLKIIRYVGPERFGCIGSDSTGNTKVARENVNVICPTIVVLPDPCHHLSNKIKDICKLEYFKEPIVQMRTTIKYFSKSTYGSTHMAAQRVTLDINKGLEKPLAFLKKLPVYSTFNLRLTQLVCVLEPIARAIKCLEGLNTNVSDVWKFYIAISAVIRDLFSENSQGYPTEVQEAIRQIVNSRFKEMMGVEGGVIYLAGFFLDPAQITSPILKKSQANVLERGAVRIRGIPANRADQDLRDAIPVYAKVGIFLVKMLYREMQSRLIPECSHYGNSDAAVSALKLQLEAYARQSAPFCNRSPMWSAIKYWREMARSPHADVLSFVAIKIFSMLLNSMPEERTVSSFTRMNSTDRSCQKAASVVGMTKIRQDNRRLARAREPPTNLPNLPQLNWRSIGTLFSPSTKAAAREKSSSIAPIPQLKVNASDFQVPAAQGTSSNFTTDAQMGLGVLEDDPDQEPDECAEHSDNRTSFDVESTIIGDGIDLSLAYFRDLLSDAPISASTVSNSVGSAVDVGTKAFEVIGSVADLDF